MSQNFIGYIPNMKILEDIIKYIKIYITASILTYRETKNVSRDQKNI